jgi:Cdc6-like AAA superfamily ATPase
MRKRSSVAAEVLGKQGKRASKKRQKSGQSSLQSSAAARNFGCGDYVLLQAPSDCHDSRHGTPWNKDAVKKRARGDKRSAEETDQSCAASDSFWIAQVVKIWRHDGDLEDRILVKWFYRMKDLYHWHSTVGPAEVFESEHMDENEASCVIRKCRILCEMEWRLDCLEENHVKAPEEKSELATFLCRERYDFATGSFAPSTMTIRWAQERGAAQSLFAESGRAANLSDLSTIALLRYMQDDAFQFEDESDLLQQKSVDGDPADDAWDPEEESSSRQSYRTMRQSAMAKMHRSKGTVRGELATFSRASRQLLLPEISERGGTERGARDVPEMLSIDRERQGNTSEKTHTSRFWAPAVHLPCRESEIDQVMKFLEGCMNGSSERCMYISGVPGTGKTAVVRCAIQQLELKRARGDVPHFQYAEINGMAIPDPHAAYSILLHKLGHRGPFGFGSKRLHASAEAARLLDRRFRSKSKTSKRMNSSLVIVLDEMDALVLNNSSAAQRVLYDFLDWTIQPNSELVVIGIANTLDLPERLLPRLASRLGLNRLVFKPYTKAQVGLILRHRLGSDLSLCFHEDAIELCTRKVAAVSGDIRRAMAICLHAYTLWNRKRQSHGTHAISEDEKISAIDIDEAIRDLTPSCVQQVTAQLSDTEQAVLICAALCSRQAVQQGSEAFQFAQIWHRFWQLQHLLGAQANDDSGEDSAELLWHTLMRLCSCHLLSCVTSASSSFALESACIQYSSPCECKFVMNPMYDDVAFALRGHQAFVHFRDENL